MALTDLAIARARHGAKIIKLSDGGGLQLRITPEGAKRWRIAYRFGGSQKTLAVGVYPNVGLKNARDAREAARKTLAQGQDPLLVKKAAKATKAEEGANTFAAIAGELTEKKWRDKKAASTMRKFEWFMSFAFPALGARGLGGSQTGRGARHVRNRPKASNGDRRRISLCDRRSARRQRPNVSLEGCACYTHGYAARGQRRIAGKARAVRKRPFIPSANCYPTPWT
jgi:hypothetical protein